ncbi:MAG: YheV family putative zinc ribbon protein [Porticoccaceae bacterium]
MYSATRRFVAGAICPHCKMADRTVVFRRDGQDHRECVACGFGETGAGALTSTPPVTRPERTVRLEQAMPEPVRLIDPERFAK